MDEFNEQVYLWATYYSADKKIFPGVISMIAEQISDITNFQQESIQINSTKNKIL